MKYVVIVFVAGIIYILFSASMRVFQGRQAAISEANLMRSNPLENAIVQVDSIKKLKPEEVTVKSVDPEEEIDEAPETIRWWHCELTLTIEPQDNDVVWRLSQLELIESPSKQDPDTEDPFLDASVFIDEIRCNDSEDSSDDVTIDSVIGKKQLLLKIEVEDMTEELALLYGDHIVSTIKLID